MYYNENTIIYFNNEFVKATEARPDIYGQSLHYGYAVFEGMRAYNTENGVKIFKVAEHFDRMKYSCEAVGIPYPYDNNELALIFPTRFWKKMTSKTLISVPWSFAPRT